MCPAPVVTEREKALIVLLGGCRQNVGPMGWPPHKRPFRSPLLQASPAEIAPKWDPWVAECGHLAFLRHAPSPQTILARTAWRRSPPHSTASIGSHSCPFGDTSVVSLILDIPPRIEIG